MSAVMAVASNTPRKETAVGVWFFASPSTRSLLHRHNVKVFNSRLFVRKLLLQCVHRTESVARTSIPAISSVARSSVLAARGAARPLCGGGAVAHRGGTGRSCPRWAQPQGTPAATASRHPRHGQGEARPGLSLRIGRDIPGRVETGLVGGSPTFHVTAQLCTWWCVTSMPGVTLFPQKKTSRNW